MRVGWSEILLVLLIVLILFGARKLPELARALGRSLGEFKKGRDDGEHLASPTDDKSSPDSETGKKP